MIERRRDWVRTETGIARMPIHVFVEAEAIAVWISRASERLTRSKLRGAWNSYAALLVAGSIVELNGSYIPLRQLISAGYGGHLNSASHKHATSLATWALALSDAPVDSGPLDFDDMLERVAELAQSRNPCRRSDGARARWLEINSAALHLPKVVGAALIASTWPVLVKNPDHHFAAGVIFGRELQRSGISQIFLPIDGSTFITGMRSHDRIKNVFNVLERRLINFP